MSSRFCSENGIDFICWSKPVDWDERIDPRRCTGNYVRSQSDPLPVDQEMSISMPPIFEAARL